MNPIILDKTTKNEILSFTIRNIDVSVANAIRRTILSGIETIGIRSSPHNENNVIIKTNTCRINNEIIAHRLSLIPIYELTKDNYEKYIIEINEENKTDQLYYVTTEHIKILNVLENKYLNKASVEKIFPPWIAPNGNKYYIEIVPLRPKIGNIDGEKLNLTASLSIESSKKDSCFNLTNICYYTNTLDPIKIKTEEKIEKERVIEEKKIENIEQYMKNWNLLDKYRHTFDNSFDFKIKTSSKYTNEELVRLSCHKIIENLEKIKEMESIRIKSKISTIENCFDIEFDNIDYTIGNVLNKILLEKMEDTICYCAFKLTHPHNIFGTMTIAFKMNVGNDIVLQHIKKSCDIGIDIFDKIEKLI